ncbi:MAG: dephospho-CoA kinase [Elusimicrobiota bacterium]|nr:dephospho-CoA kinase [Elusimicrobiota bacterium]
MPPNKNIICLRIGVTGKFASGKSEVLKVFSESGFPVCSADEIAHRLLEKENPEAYEVLKIFGSGIADKNGEICRGKLGKLVFNSVPLMKKLESIMHPVIKSEMERFFAENPVCAVENALLFKMGMQNDFDKIVLVKCPEAIREKNIAARGISSSAAEKIFSFQPDAFYAAQKERPDIFLIENNGSVPALREKTQKLICGQWGWRL